MTRACVFALACPALALVLAAGCGSSTPSSTSQPADDPVDEEVATVDLSPYTVLQSTPDRVVASLGNGMIIVAQRLTAAPVVSAQIWVETGSIYEGRYVGAGVSHFLEHLLAGGTTTTRAEAESNAMLGAIGAQINAATGLDTVRYYINAPSEHAVTTIDLLTDWVRNNAIAPSEFAREQEVIRSEFAQGRGDPGRVMWKLTQQARYADLPTHPAGHPTIGYLDEFNAITRDDIVDFYRAMYVPNNMVFVVAGDVDPWAMVEAISTRWRDAVPGELPEVKFPAEAKAGPERSEGPDGASQPLTARAAVARPRVRLAFPGTRLAGEHDFALDLLAVVLGQGESSRLVRDLRDERGLVTSVVAYNLSFNWGEGFFAVDFEPAAPGSGDGTTTTGDLAGPVAGIDAARAAVLGELRRVRTEPVSGDELRRAKRQTVSRIVKSGQSAFDLAARLGRDTIGMHDVDYLDRYRHAIDAITADDLRAAAAAILDERELIEVRLLPLEEGVEPTDLTRPDEREAAVAGVTYERVELGNAPVLEGLRERLADGGEHTPIVVEPAEMFTLDHGLRLIVQRSTVVPAAAIHVYWKGGLLADAPGREGVTHAAAEMLTRGTESMTAAELAARIDGLGATLTTAAGNNTTYVRATALGEDVDELIGLIGDVVMRPAFDDAEWERTRPRLLAAIDRQTDRWFGELNDAFRQRYYAGHPWAETTLGRRDVVASLTADDLRHHHRATLAAADTVIGVVGDVDPAAVRVAVAEAFAALPAADGSAGGFDPPTPSAPSPGVFQRASDKPLTAVYVGLGPGVTSGDPDYPALRVLTTVLSDFPGGWLEQKLRGEGGGIAYAVSAWAQAGLVPGHVAVVFSTRPDAAVEGVSVSFEAIERARRGAFTDADLDRAKAKLLAEAARRRQTNDGRAAEFALDTLYGLPDPLSDAATERIAAVTLDDLRRVAAERLTDPVTVVLTHTPLDDEALAAAVQGEAVSAGEPSSD